MVDNKRVSTGSTTGSREDGTCSSAGCGPAGTGAPTWPTASCCGNRRLEPPTACWGFPGDRNRIDAGTLGAALALQINTAQAYTALILANAASYLCCGLLLLRVPTYKPLPRPERHPRPAALADRPFAAFAALEGAMGLQYQAISLLLPIWITVHTHAPRWTVAGAFAMNLAVCILLQARIGATVETPRQGGRAFRRAGMLFLVSCPLIALCADVPGWIAVVLLAGAMCVHSIGEVWQSSASNALGFALAPDHSQGQYQGLLGFGFDTGQTLAPAVLVTAVLNLGQTGRLSLGVFLALLGLAGPAVTGWARADPLGSPRSRSHRPANDAESSCLPCRCSRLSRRYRRLNSRWVTSALPPWAGGWCGIIGGFTAPPVQPPSRSGLDGT